MGSASAIYDLQTSRDELIGLEPVSCQCRSNYDCRRSLGCPNTCVFNKYSNIGTCRYQLSTRAPTPFPTRAPVEQPCSCNSDYDCLQSRYCPNTCVFFAYSRTGKCSNPPPTKQPTKAPMKQPTLPPTKQPTKPTNDCTCHTDYECKSSPYCPNTCVKSPYSNIGQCGDSNPTPPTKEPTPGPPTSQCCDEPRPIPTACEVEILIQLMDTAVRVNRAIIAQWLRLSFHDAGSFDQHVPEGGANGCLLTHPPMRTQSENLNLDLALNTLQTIKNSWEGNPETCLEVSAADMIQFAGWFSVIRQKDIPGLTPAKIDELVHRFRWGRIDELNCDIAWTDNLPGFSLGTNPSDIPNRCLFAGGEIKEKMMDRNGFTAEEATVMMGAHTIGLTRNVFQPFSAAPWVSNGADGATPNGPVFDNTFHDFLENTIVESTATDFASNILPFDQVFPDWFRDNLGDLNHLDTDVALAFPSQNTGIHPHFDVFTKAFAADNGVFVATFMQALDKMSSLGVTVQLFHVLPCEEGCTNEEGATVSTEELLVFQKDLEESIFVAEEQLAQTREARAQEVKVLTTPVMEEFLK